MGWATLWPGPEQSHTRSWRRVRTNRNAMASPAMSQAISVSGKTDGYVGSGVGADRDAPGGLSATTLRRVLDDVADVGTPPRRRAAHRLGGYARGYDPLG